MKRKQICLQLILAAALCLAASSMVLAQDPGIAAASIQKPVLKWSRGGCYSSWCETGWYSSPATADLDGNGTTEVVAATYSVFALNGKTGAEIWRVDPPGGRAWPGVVVADLEWDGDLEIVTAHGDGYVYVFDTQGNILWSAQPTPGNELRSLAVSDLEGDGNLEILVASTRSENQWYVYEHNGQIRAGSWPQHYPNSDTNGYSAGCFNQNLAVGDIDGDGRAEIIGPSDVHYITAYEDSGSQIRANLIYGTNPDGSQKYWSRVGVHVDHAVDLRGYANCGTEHRPNFAHSAPLVADVNGDGVFEAIVVGNVYNCGTSPYTSLYEMPFIFNADRTRWAADGFNWVAIPVPDGHAAPLSEDYNQIENTHPNPVAVDLDGDGFLEILFPSYDGRMHALWLDKTEHGAWPFEVTHSGEGFLRFASEPVVADLDNNGLAEVIFSSWTEKGSDETGKLHILDYLGNPIWEVELPAAVGSPDWNGGLAAPTLADIDGDTELEVVVNTAHSGVAAYDLPGSSDAGLLWATGRGGYLRSGSQAGIAFKKEVSQGSAEMGETLVYTLTLVGAGQVVTITDAIPSGTVYQAGSAQVDPALGVLTVDAGDISWTGLLDQGQELKLSFSVTVSTEGPQTVTNQAEADDGQTNLIRSARTVVGGTQIYLPALLQQ